jgi:hypothetical protein
LGLGTAGLSAAMLSRSSAASVSFRLFWPRSRDFPGLVAREVELSVSAERSAESTVSCSQMSLPWSDLIRVSISSLSLMFSRRAASSSLSMREEGASPRAGNVRSRHRGVGREESLYLYVFLVGLLARESFLVWCRIEPGWFVNRCTEDLKIERNCTCELADHGMFGNGLGRRASHVALTKKR